LGVTSCKCLTLESLRGYLAIALDLALDSTLSGFGLLRSDQKPQVSDDLGPWKRVPDNYVIADKEHTTMDVDKYCILNPESIGFN